MPKPAPPPVDLGIIVALKEEARELLLLAGEREPRDDGAMNSFLFTRGHYRCVVTVVGPMGEMEAARITERQIAIFAPACVVSVGISGGVHKDLRVGDVFIPSHAVQYMQDAKASPLSSGGFHLVPGAPVVEPEFELYTRASGFELSQVALFDRWRADARADLEALIPDAAAREQLLAADLVRADADLLTTGHEASGPVVSAAAAFSTWIQTFDRRIMGLDMETAAVLTVARARAGARPALAIRGISDYGDDRKAKLDDTGKGALRKYAMRNAVRALWALLEAEALPRRAGLTPAALDAEAPPRRAGLTPAAPEAEAPRHVTPAGAGTLPSAPMPSSPVGPPGPAAPPPAAPLTRDQLLDALSRMLPAQFEQLLDRLGVPVGDLAGPMAGQKMRAVDLLRWADQAGALAEVHAAHAEITARRGRRS
jgi:nucleoside phosphorylase